jgi:predicted transcriptional regulator of viral defense system
MRLKKGLYYIIPFEKDPKSFMLDWYIIASHLVNGAYHYIGYFYAIQIHILITQQ